MFDRQASLYQVCEGFGAPDAGGFTLTPTQQCAIIAAAATYAGPVVSAGVSGGCETGSVITDFRSHNWAGAVKGVGCGYFSDIFAGSVAVFVAGAASPTGPGAVAVGVATYRALSASLKLVCGGVFPSGATQLGRALEAKHETAVALDIIRKGQCLEQTKKSVIGIQWWAVGCPAAIANVRRPVTVCPTTAVNGGIEKGSSSITVAAPSSIAAQMRGYDASGIVLAGPSAWTCSSFIYGDGGQNIGIWPAVERKPPWTTGNPWPRPLAVAATYIPACALCKADLACPFFPAAGKHYGFPCTTSVPPGEKVTRVSGTTVMFEDPPYTHGTSSYSGGKYRVYGIVVYVPDSSTRAGFAFQETCTMPDLDGSLCKATINTAARSIRG